MIVREANYKDMCINFMKQNDRIPVIILSESKKVARKKW